MTVIEERYEVKCIKIGMRAVLINKLKTIICVLYFDRLASS